MDKIITTISEWIAPNGHKVTATYERRALNNKGSYGARDAFYVKTIYVCECGKMHWNNKRATKAELANHDAYWYTQAESEALIARMRESIGL
jgi:hypothetical protein